MKLKLLFLCAFFAVCSGCSAQLSPMEESGDEKTIYEINSEQLIFKTIRAQLVHDFPDTQIADLAGPVHGYVVTPKNLIEKAEVIVRVIPAYGVTAKNKRVFGYYIEVNSTGEILTKFRSAGSIYKNINAELARIGRTVTVRQVLPTEYKKN